MYFIDALNLLDLCLEHGVLVQRDGLVLVIHENGDGVLWDKTLLAQELMTDEVGQKALLEALADKGETFTQFDFGPLERAIELTAPKNQQ